MDEFGGLTPEDFRHAWPTAYKLAVHQAFLLHQHAERQLGKATEQARWTRETSEAARRQLEDVRRHLEESLRQATCECTESLAGLVALIQRDALDLARREQEFGAARLDQDRRVSALLATLRRRYLGHVDAPLIARLRWAISPRSARLSPFNHKKEESK